MALAGMVPRPELAFTVTLAVAAAGAAAAGWPPNPARPDAARPNTASVSAAGGRDRPRARPARCLAASARPLLIVMIVIPARTWASCRTDPRQTLRTGAPGSRLGSPASRRPPGGARDHPGPGQQASRTGGMK